MSGIKFDVDKLRYSLECPWARRESAAVLTYGSVKYEASNWRKIEKERYHDALRRHVGAMLIGEVVDPENQLLHASEAETCVHFLAGLELQENPELRKTFDERYKYAIKVAHEMRKDRLARLEAK